MLFSLKSNLVDVIARQIYAAEIFIEEDRIKKIVRLSEKVSGYIMPGFIDAHVHVESSMLVPAEFARLAVLHGTVATISDPHEIANVMSVSGVDYMIENGKKIHFHFFFGAPSCVPATNFETAGAIINSHDIDALLHRPEIIYMAEMMNYPGVIYHDDEVRKKLLVAKKHRKPIDGHAPGLRGEMMRNYFNAGITTDHECFKYDEALEKLQHGVKVMIREGSAVKNFEELIPLIKEFPQMIMFCSDDKHPDNLLEGHINDLVKRALSKGYDFFDVIRAASYNVVQHYNLQVGLLRENDSADFIVVDDLKNLNILQTFIKGNLVAEKGKSFIHSSPAPIVNNFNCSPKKPNDFRLPIKGDTIRVIEVIDGQLITNEIHAEALNKNDYVESDIKNDILKIAVVNRYHNAPVSIAFIRNVGLRQGAIASCIAHDCHNIVVAGVSDLDICNAVNLIIKAKGGISLANGNDKHILELPIAGIMTNKDAYQIAKEYSEIDLKAKALGSKLKAPFMSLSFMALLVIPELKLSDKGLFNGKTFEFTDIFIQTSDATKNHPR